MALSLPGEGDTVYLAFSSVAGESIEGSRDYISRSMTALFPDSREIGVFNTEYNPSGVDIREIMGENSSHTGRRSLGEEVVFSIPLPRKSDYFKNRSAAVRLKAVFALMREHNPHFTSHDS